MAHTIEGCKVLGCVSLDDPLRLGVALARLLKRTNDPQLPQLAGELEEVFDRLDLRGVSEERDRLSGGGELTRPLVWISIAIALEAA